MTVARRWVPVVALVVVAAAAAIWWRFATDLAAARARVALGSTVIETPCGLIEYQEAGSGPPLLAVHGSGGGFDQGMAFAAPLTARGIRVIAMSRFGYLRTPMPADGSPEAQADAFVCLMDALEVPTAAVMGGSAGALSALQLAVRHPDRVSALILLVPLGYKPPGQPNSAPPMAPWVEAAMMRVIGSDFLFWSALHIAPKPGHRHRPCHSTRPFGQGQPCRTGPDQRNAGRHPARISPCCRAARRHRRKQVDDPR